LDEHGNAVECEDLYTWAVWLETAGNRIVAKDEFPDCRVSTVFLGLDHNFNDGPPLLWETMIFGGEHDQHQERYTSRAGALEGHEKACALVSGVKA
jgi:hypothetical protein